MAFLSTLTDNFNTAGAIDGTKWTFSNAGLAGSASNSGGELVLDTVSNTAYNGDANVYSSTGYDLTGSGAYVRLTSLTSWPTVTAGTETYFQLEGVSNPASEFLRFEIDSDHNVTILANNVGSGAFYGATYTYDSTNWAWLRIRESAGTVYWDTAPTTASNPPASGDWVNRGSTATSGLAFTSGLTVAARMRIRINTNAASSQTCHFDGFNTASGSGGATYNDTRTETMTLGSSQTATINYAVARTETMTLTPAAASGTSLAVATTETMTISASNVSSFAYPVGVTETMALSATASAVRAYFGNAVETMTMSDVLNGAQFWTAIDTGGDTPWTTISD